MASIRTKVGRVRPVGRGVSGLLGPPVRVGAWSSRRGASGGGRPLVWACHVAVPPPACGEGGGGWAVRRCTPLGQPVLVNNPALPEPIRGKVLFVSSKANIQKNTLEVKVALDSPVAVFKPDMLVNVTHLAPKQADQVANASAAMRIYVPQQLVMHDDSGTFVWVADQSDRAARKTSISTGAAGNGGLVEVTQGLAPGSRVISRGYESLDDGDRISVVDEDGDQVASNTTSTHSGTPLHRLPQGE